MQSRKNGKSIWKKLRAKLLGLLLGLMLMVSGCASNLQMQPNVAPRVTVDPSLMVEPNYTQTLLDFLSDKPSEQTPK